MADLEKLIELIEARIDLADIHKTNFVYFTPAERKRIRAWLYQLKGKGKTQVFQYGDMPTV